jgi:hypothetical protein
MRWPSVHWHLALALQNAAPPEQLALASIFDGLNTYLGNYIGELLGELSCNVFFLLTSVTWLKSGRRSPWVGWLGLATAVLGLVGMFRNVTQAVAPVAGVNNYLLPVFMIILGVSFVRWPATDASAGA